MLTNAFLYAALLPLATSAVTALLLWRLRCPRQITLPLATTAGFLTAEFTRRGRAGFAESVRTFLRPHEAVDWLPHIVLLALGVSILMHLAPARRAWLVALASALCLAVPVRLLSGNVARHWTAPEKLAVVLSLAAVLGLVWLLLGSNGNKKAALLSAALQFMVAVGTAIVLTQSGALMYGLSSAALGTAITGTAVILAFRDKTSDWATPTAGVVTLSLGSLLILGHFFAELSTMNGALLLFALLATAVPLGSRPAWQQSAARVICCLIPLGIAVAGVTLFAKQ